MLARGLRRVKPASGAGDPYFSNVSLLLHGDGTNGSTTFTDNSPSPKTLTVLGNAQISTTQKKYGTGSMKFDGSGDYARTPSSTALQFGTGDLTAECWVYRTAVGNLPGFFQISTNTNGLQSSATNTIAAGITTGGTEVVMYAKNAFNVSASAAGTALNTWIHFAVVRSSGTTKLYVNGTAVITVASDTTNYTGTYLAVGGLYSTNNLLTGYIDDLRITKGVARYTADFTPPTQAFPDA